MANLHRSPSRESEQPRVGEATRVTLSERWYKCFVKKDIPKEHNMAFLTAFKSSIVKHSVTYILFPSLPFPALNRSNLENKDANTMSAFTQFG